jgi:DNA-binding NarL/FixJ family response regulator
MSMEKIHIVLVDDHQIVRDGIKMLLTGEAEFMIVGEAAGYEQLKQILAKVHADVVILDINLQGISGIEITRLLSITHPGLRVLILSMYTNDDFVINAIKAGAKGYLPKNTTRKELIGAVYAIAEGEEYFSEGIASILLKNFVRKAQGGDDSGEGEKDSLSRREIEILGLVASGYSNQQIADKLFISIRTVESHKNHIMQKLKLKSTVDLLKFAIRNNITDL